MSFSLRVVTMWFFFVDILFDLGNCLSRVTPYQATVHVVNRMLLRVFFCRMEVALQGQCKMCTCCAVALCRYFACAGGAV